MTGRSGRWFVAMIVGMATPMIVLSLGCCCGGGMGSGSGGTDPWATGSAETGAEAVADTSSSDEPAADTAHPQTIDREGFTVQYPGNWSIDTDDPDYDPDALFSIDTAGNCFVMFHLWNHEIDLTEATAGQVREFSEMLSGTTVTDFTTWGSFEGDGKQIKGTFIILPTTVRAFAYSKGERSFLASEFCYDEDSGAADPGFELVRGSFKLK